MSAESPKSKPIVHLLIGTLGTIVLAFGAFLSWLLKDGLGPGMIESKGTLAASRFLEGFWPWATIGLTLVAFSASLFIRFRRNGRLPRA